MPNFATRSQQLEWMDTDTVTAAAFDNCLKDLTKVNIGTLAYRPTLQWLKQIFHNFKPQRPIVIFDIGSGGGDMLRQIWRLAKRYNVAVELYGMDINPLAQQSAKVHTSVETPIHFETVDIYQIAAARQADFVISSLFTHHLNNTELLKFIGWMEQHATQGWFINDLHRHPIPYYFVKYLFAALPLDPMVKHDGPISIERAFVKQDWQTLLHQANIPAAQSAIRWWFPFRYCVNRWR